MASAVDQEEKFSSKPEVELRASHQESQPPETIGESMTAVQLPHKVPYV